MDAEQTAVFGAFKYIRAPQLNKNKTFDPLSQRLKPMAKQITGWLTYIRMNQPMACVFTMAGYLKDSHCSPHGAMQVPSHAPLPLWGTQESTRILPESNPESIFDKISLDWS